MISLESTLEIKTRVIYKRIEIQEVALQLWISQTPKLMQAYYQRGTFLVLEIEDVAANIKTQEEGNQGDLKKLAALITQIISVVKRCSGNAIVKYNRLADKLVIQKVDKKKMLLDDLYSMQDNGADAKASLDNNVAAVKPVNGIEGKADSKSAIFSLGDRKGKL